MARKRANLTGKALSFMVGLATSGLIVMILKLGGIPMEEIVKYVALLFILVAGFIAGLLAA
ncbi:hypothetical protein KKF82_08705 [Patescibacteria group bacterium]|nr:hypothetical protein [Patescibacteria group bacterium]